MNLHVPHTLSNQLPVLVEFVGAYLEAVEFTEFGADDQPPAGSTFSDAAVYRAFNDCADFLSNNIDVVNQAIEEHHGYTITQAGHDFWLTRNGHGAGFWDRGLDNIVDGSTKTIGDALSDASKSFAELSVFEDTGLVYFEF
jgi:hypothetical protein